MIPTTKIALGLGSNLEPRLDYLRRAVWALQTDFLIDLESSSVFETPPWGIAEQPFFYNAVVVGQCEWKPPAIVNYLKNLEIELGRQSRVRNGPREIDLDLLVFGGEVWASEGVTVPHPGFAEREFVLAPFVELWPDWIAPADGRSARAMLAALRETQPTSATKIAPPLLDTETP